MQVDVELQTNELDLYGIPPTVSGGGGGAVDSVNGQTAVVVLDQDDVLDGTTYKQYSQTEKTKLAGIEALAEVNNISDVDATDLTGGGSTTLHLHDGRYYTETETDALLSAKRSSVLSKASRPDGLTDRDYTVLGGFAAVSSSSAIFSTNRWNFEPAVIYDTVTLDRVAIEVAVASAAGKLVRIALYTADEYWQPATLVQDFGTVPADPGVVPALQVITISPTLTLQPGRYMTVWITDGGGSFRRVAGTQPAGFGYLSGVAGASCIRSVFASLGGGTTITSGFAAVNPKWERDIYGASTTNNHSIRYREV